MIVKLLTEHHLEILSLKGGCRGSSESTHVKMPHCWKPHATDQLSRIVGGMLILDKQEKHLFYNMINFSMQFSAVVNIYILKA